MFSAHHLRSVVAFVALAAVGLDVSIAWMASQGNLAGDSAFADIVLVTVVAWKLSQPLVCRSLRLERQAVLRRLERAYRGFDHSRTADMPASAKETGEFPVGEGI